MRLGMEEDEEWEMEEGDRIFYTALCPEDEKRPWASLGPAEEHIQAYSTIST